MSFNREAALHFAAACSDAVKVSQDASSAWAWRNDLGLVCLPGILRWTWGLPTRFSHRPSTVQTEVLNR